MIEISATDQISNLFLYSRMVDYHQEQLQQQIEFRVSFAVGFLAAKIYEGGRIETYTIYWLGALSLQ